MKELVEKINKLKKVKNAVILAHCYQNVEIDEVADYVGDSLYLSQMAAKNRCRHNSFCRSLLYGSNGKNFMS